MFVTHSVVRLLMRDPDTPGGFKLSMAWRPASSSSDAMANWAILPTKLVKIYVIRTEAAAQKYGSSTFLVCFCLLLSQDTQRSSKRLIVTGPKSSLFPPKVKYFTTDRGAAEKNVWRSVYKVARDCTDDKDKNGAVQRDASVGSAKLRDRR
jgi:hypothetical protein